MDESDNFLFMSLRQIGIPLPPGLESLARVGANELRNICIGFFRKLGIDERPYLSNDPSQRFRIANSLCEELNRLLSRTFEITLFLSPTPGDVRKVIVDLISKVSNTEEETKAKESFQTVEEQIQTFKRRQRKKAISEWLKDDWIHPALRTTSEIEANSILRSFTIGSLSGLNDPLARLCSLQATAHFVAGFHEMTGESTAILQALAREDAGRDPERRQQRREIIVKSNRDKWNAVKSSQGLRRALANISVKADGLEEGQEPSIFQVAVDLRKAGEREPTKPADGEVAIETDLELLRRRHKEELERLNTELRKLQDEFRQETETRQTEEERKTRLEHEIEDLKAMNVEIQKNIDTLHEFATALENPEKSQEELNKEVKTLEAEIGESKKEWQVHRKEAMDAIKHVKGEIEVKREKFEELKDKMKFIDEDYDRLTENIKNNIEQRKALNEEFQKIPKEITRAAFVKRITDIHTNVSKQKTDLGKILRELKELEESITTSANTLERYCTEIDNFLVQHPKKAENVYRTIAKHFKEFKEIFEKTRQLINEMGKNKLDSRELEQKIELLQSRKYKENIDKLSQDLNNLRSDNEQMLKRIKQGV